MDPPPMLCGDDSDRWEVDLWLFSAELWLKASGVTQTAVACAATATRFQKHALRWWQDEMRKALIKGLSDPYTDWDEFKKDLKNFLMPPELIAKARKELYRIYQRPGESTLNYVTRYRAQKARVEDLAPHEELHVFVTGLPHKLRMEVERDDPKDVDTAIKTALRLANVYELDPRRSDNRGMGRGRQNPGSGRYFGSTSSGRSFNGPTPMELGMVSSGRNRMPKSNGNRSSRDTQRNRNTRSNQGQGRRTQQRTAPEMSAEEVQRHINNRLCFRCHQPGHRAFRCPN